MDVGDFRWFLMIFHEKIMNFDFIRIVLRYYLELGAEILIRNRWDGIFLSGWIFSIEKNRPKKNRSKIDQKNRPADFFRSFFFDPKKFSTDFFDRSFLIERFASRRVTEHQQTHRTSKDFG